eukprot:TRINITY_DN2563_c0_g1_i3.p1 TRINITY_DN2563_c0_g1~~TRINITY_DN2563_c0_g1_i3.p1  ORF type:complete len:266 (-),score=26.69 TRINITY_DN2563_c0_g1_i3:281-1078(-)
MERRRPKLHEVWPGKNNIYCGGRLITGPDRICFWIAEIMILGPTVVFWWFVSIPLALAHPILGSIVCVGNVISTLTMVFSHFKAAFLDPGIVPRGREEVPENCVKEEEIGGHTVNLSFCKTCRIWKPPRAHHCRTCDNCVLEFDHHCPWVGNCVGQGNYRWFNFFLWSVIFGSIYLFFCAGLHFGLMLHEPKATWVDTVKAYPADVGLMSYSFFICLSIFGLCGYHCNLMCKGKTTYENVSLSFSFLFCDGIFPFGLVLRELYDS